VPDDEGRSPDDPDRPPRYDTEPLPVFGQRPPPPPPGLRQVVPRGRFRRPRMDVEGDLSEALTDAVITTVEGEPIPSSLVHKYLFASERFVGEWRRHWTYLWKEGAAVVAATFLLGYVSGTTSAEANTFVGAATVVWAIVLSWALWRVGDWYFDRFVLTSRRVMIVSGMITRNIAMMPLARVTDMAYNQSAMGRVLGFGTFILESAGQEQALRVVRFLPDPRELYLLMVEEMYGPDPKANPKRPRQKKDRNAGDDA
jgi:membrane protein YdbS with pleckstrin-like domain